MLQWHTKASLKVGPHYKLSHNQVLGPSACWQCRTHHHHNMHTMSVNVMLGMPGPAMTKPPLLTSPHIRAADSHGQNHSQYYSHMQTVLQTVLQTV